MAERFENGVERPLEFQMNWTDTCRMIWSCQTKNKHSDFKFAAFYNDMEWIEQVGRLSYVRYAKIINENITVFSQKVYFSQIKYNF